MACFVTAASTPPTSGARHPSEPHWFETSVEFLAHHLLNSVSGIVYYVFGEDVFIPDYARILIGFRIVVALHGTGLAAKQAVQNRTYRVFGGRAYTC
jgi:hypothetical protein